ncbi:hypothetical protein GCM10022200_26750 [Microbacterium awajiense]|uniref:Pyridoxamine 5'-phosphate oxidase family protein n=1 Tax=Microbacterium awajiense TaxID=415214 RepID=A0ABP7AVE3_9MICO
MVTAANPYLTRIDPASPAPAASGVEELAPSECWRYVTASEVGRLAIATDGGRPEVFPIDFRVHDGAVYLRSAPGTKLRLMAQHPAVAFEVDGSDARAYWSVVIQADAHRLDTDADIEASGILDLDSSSPTAKHNYVRLSPVAITGRRFPRRDRSNATGDRHDDKPWPIPHFAPIHP